MCSDSKVIVEHVFLPKVPHEIIDCFISKVWEERQLAEDNLSISEVVIQTLGNLAILQSFHDDDTSPKYGKSTLEEVPSVRFRDLGIPVTPHQKSRLCERSNSDS